MRAFFVSSIRRCEAMVKLVQHLCLIKGQEAVVRLGAKQVAVVGHVEHREKTNTPRILPCSIIHEHWHTSVNLFDEFGVRPRPKNGSSKRIGIKQSQVLGI